MPRRLLMLSTLGILVLSLSACGRKEKTADMYPVSGTVTLDGKPLAKGSIVLDPKGGAGTPVSGGIENGEFKLKAPLGEKIVRISAMEETEEKDQYGSKVTKSIIPLNYNTNSTLTETVKEGENTFKITLVTKK